MSATKKTDIESLVSAAQSGSGEAINALVHAMRPTVEMIAMKYIHSPLEKDDLVQEGMIGLLAALRAYQPKRGAAFRTFAGTCIENAIPRCVNSVGAKMFPRIIWFPWRTIWIMPVQPSARRTIFWPQRVWRA